MSDDPTIVTMRERVRVVKVDKDHPEKEPEIIEQETSTPISLTDAALLGFVPGQGFNPSPSYEHAFSTAEINRHWDALSNSINSDADGPPPPVEGVRVGDQ